MEEVVLPTAVVTYRISDMYGALFHSWRRLIRLLVIIELLWVALSIGFNVMDGATLSQAVTWLPWKILGWGALALSLFWFGLCPLLAYVRLKRAGLLGPNAVQLVDRGIRVESPKAESTIYWPAIRRLVRSASRLYLFAASGGALILPRRVFDTEEQFEAFAKATQERWKAR